MCPGCKATREKPGAVEPTNEAEVMMQMRAASVKLRDTCKAATTDGGIPVPKEAQDAMDRTTQLEVCIANLEALKQPETDNVIQNTQAEAAQYRPEPPRSCTGSGNDKGAQGKTR